MERLIAELKSQLQRALTDLADSNKRLDVERNNTYQLQDELDRLRKQLADVFPDWRIEREKLLNIIDGLNAKVKKLYAMSAEAANDSKNISSRLLELQERCRLQDLELADLRARVQALKVQNGNLADQANLAKESDRMAQLRLEEKKHQLLMMKQDLDAALFQAALNSGDRDSWRSQAEMLEVERRGLRDQLNEMTPRMFSANKNEKAYLERLRLAESELEDLRRQLSEIDEHNRKLSTAKDNMLVIVETHKSQN